MTLVGSLPTQEATTFDPTTNSTGRSPRTDLVEPTVKVVPIWSFRRDDLKCHNISLATQSAAGFKSTSTLSGRAISLQTGRRTIGIDPPAFVESFVCFML